MNNQKLGYTSEELRDATEKIRTLSGQDIYCRFMDLWFQISHGNTLRAVLEPETGEINFYESAGEEYSAEEYYREKGSMSRETIWARSRDHWEPTPDDDWDWEEIQAADADEASFVRDSDNHGDWITFDAWKGLAEDEQEKYTSWFTLGCRPYDGWDNYQTGTNEIELLEERLQEKHVRIIGDHNFLIGTLIPPAHYRTRSHE